MTITKLSRLPLPLRLGIPLVAAGLLAAGCSNSSGHSGSSSGVAAGAASTPAGSTSSSASAGAVITTGSGADGTFLTGGSGRAVYLWTADSKDKSSCSGACAGAWPPVTSTGKPTAGGGAQAADLGVISRSDGSKQVTYDGHPLYYFAGDSGPGQTHGQGSDAFGAQWWLLAPSGAAITGSTANATSSSPAGSNSSSGYGAGGGYG